MTDVNICPICHRYIGGNTDEYDRKHIINCREECLSVRRGRGRPKKVETEEEIIPVLEKVCRTCGQFGCVGKDDKDSCDEWCPRPMENCPLCGRKPQERWMNGLLTSIECGHCKLKMDAYNMRNGSLLLIQMWNERKM